MKGRESGMPEEAAWEQFFDAAGIVEQFECAPTGRERIAEFGCGYGTFTLPVAKRTSGVVHAFDIEPELVDLVRRKAGAEGVSNVRAEARDFVTHGTGLPEEAVDHVMIYNLLHLEDPIRLLREAHRILRAGGVVSILHWKTDPTTPRGPPMEIRPRPEQCRAWAEAAGFEFLRHDDLSSCCRYHYGLRLVRPAPRA